MNKTHGKIKAPTAAPGSRGFLCLPGKAMKVNVSLSGLFLGMLRPG